MDPALSSGDRVIYATFRVKDCEAEFYLNGIFCARLKDGDISVQSQAVQEILIAGTNTIEVLVGPGPTPSTARLDGPEVDLRNATVRAAVAKYKPDVPTEPEQGEILVDVRLLYKEGDPDKRRGPFSVTGSFDMPATVPRWSWQDAPVLTLDDALKAEANAVLAEIATAFRAGAVDQYVRIADVAIQEGIRAYPTWNEAQVRSEIGAVMKWHKENGGETEPFDPANQDFRLIAGGRLLQCLNKDFSAILKLKSPDGEGDLPYPVMLGRVGGKLGVVRF